MFDKCSLSLSSAGQTRRRRPRQALAWKVQEKQWKVKDRQWKVKDRQWKVKERQWKVKERQWKVKERQCSDLRVVAKRRTNRLRQRPAQPGRVRMCRTEP